MARLAGDTRYLIEIFTRVKSLLLAHNCVVCNTATNKSLFLSNAVQKIPSRTSDETEDGI